MRTTGPPAGVERLANSCDQGVRGERLRQLPKYKAELPDVPIWWLLASGIDCSDERASRVGEVQFTKSFDRDCVLDWIGNGLHELRVDIANE